MGDQRSRKIIYLAHCLLNQNAKVEGLAWFPGTFQPLMEMLENSGAGLVQLPCPELEHLGPARPLGTDTVEQYDTLEYRALCGRLAHRIASEIQSYQGAGYRVLGILGVDGSPSCSVALVPRLVSGKRRLVRGSGLFIEVLKKEMSKLGFKVPIVGIPESGSTGELREVLKRIGCQLSLK